MDGRLHTMTPEKQLASDANWMSWALAACGTLVLALLSLGYKDIKSKLDRIQKLERQVTELRAIIKIRLGVDVDDGNN